MLRVALMLGLILLINTDAIASDSCTEKLDGYLKGLVVGATLTSKTEQELLNVKRFVKDLGIYRKHKSDCETLEHLVKKEPVIEKIATLRSK